MKKVIVIGINHAGTNAVKTLLENYSDKVSVTAYDTNDNISFLGCGTALWVCGIVDNPSGLFYASKEILEEMGSVVKMRHQVGDINFADKKVKVTNLDTFESFEDSYDDLIIATGSWPNVLNVPGRELANIMQMKLFQDAEVLKSVASDEKFKHIVIVGAGYIGVELAEAYVKSGKKVTLINDVEPLKAYYDHELCKIMQENLESHGINLVIGERVIKFEGAGGVNKVVTDKQTIDADFVVTSIGFKPNTKMLEGTKVKLAPNGSIIVDKHQETSVENVYAIGDCATVYNNASKQIDSIMLATNAIRGAIVAAHSIGGTKLKSSGVQGANAIKIFDLSMYAIGISEHRAQELGFEVDSVTIQDDIRPKFMPTNEVVTLKVIWDKNSLRILGAQMCSVADLSQASYFFSLAIEEKYSIKKLALCDLFFLPHFNHPVNFVTKAGIEAIKKLV